MATGKINVSVDNIFPLIKKFLYSDHEIFLRELISNATDATLKLKHLTAIGEAKVEYGNPWTNTKMPVRMRESSDILVWDSILPLWWQIKLRSLPRVTRKTALQFTGVVMAARNSPSKKPKGKSAGLK